MNLSRTFIWRKVREWKILATHGHVATICEDFIAQYRANPVDFDIKPKKDIGTNRIIWQYWAQGYDNVPTVVRQCLDSVERWAEDYTIVRLTDANLDEYLDLPDFVTEKRRDYSHAHFADLLRLLLLKVYGGVWLDATVLLTGPIPEQYSWCDFFAFRRDPAEPNQAYWRNTYAYYFGWAKGFRVNLLNSILFAHKGSRTVSDLCNLMLIWWKDHNSLPDYFFFQILCDVYGIPNSMPLVSDTLPHYLQQSINDPKFTIMERGDIIRRIPIHKLTYK